MLIGVNNNSLNWKLLGTAMGTNNINLPPSYEELIIKVTNLKYASKIAYSFHFCKLQLTEEDDIYFQGFCKQVSGGVAGGAIALTVSKTNTQINYVYHNEVNDTSECTITVYYR